MQNEIDEIERDYLRKPLAERLEELPQVAIRRNGLGDLECEPQPVALLGQLRLRGVVRLLVQHVVHGYCDLSGDLLEELQL